MTGAEFKIYLAIFAVLVLAPAFVISLSRMVFPCGKEEEDQGGYLIGIAAYFLLTLAVFIFTVVENWDDTLDVGYITGLSVAPTLTITFHSFLILISVKFFSEFIPSRTESLCTEYHAFIFLFSGLFWFQTIYRENTNVIQWFIDNVQWFAV